MDIRIIVEEKIKAKSANDNVKTTNSTPNDKKFAQNKSNSDALKMSSLAICASNMAKSTIRQSANYFLSDIGRRNGDSNYQQLINRKLEIAQDMLSVGIGFIAGIKLGAAAGPLGAVAGAVLGVAGAGINLGFKYAERTRAYQFEMFQENNSQAYNLARANYSIQTGRVR